jgi:hypothetical protein
MGVNNSDVVERIVAEIRGAVQAALHDKSADLSAAEAAALHVGRLAAKLTLEASVATLGTGHVGPIHTGRDGVAREFHRHGEREIRTLAGPVRLRRAYYLDRGGQGGGIFPLDVRLGLGPSALSPRLEAALGELGAWIPFERVPAIVERFLGWATSEQTVRRVTEHLGELVARIEDREAREFREAPKSFEPVRRSERLAIGVDGAMAHVGGEWREAKISGVFEFDGEGEQVAGTKRYLGRIGPPERLSGPLTFEAHRAGIDSAKTVVFLGDGAPWIWNLANENFPQAVHILDFYHASEHLHAVGHARFGRDQKARKAWVNMARGRMRHDGAAWLIAQLDRFSKEAGAPPDGAQDDDPRLVLARNADYFRDNRDRMKYATYRSLGLPIGSGVIEAACKSIVQQRMKGPGMRWGVGGGPAILSARTAVLNGDLEQRVLQARRAA